jgi:hypothetical protein
MRSLEIDKRSRFLILVAFMVASMASLPHLPVVPPWGLDFQNVYVFEHCAADGSIYKADAHACGDPMDRPFIYPPLLFAFFRWVRPLALDTTLYIWTAFVIASFAGVFYLWARKITRASPLPDARHEVVTFCMLLLVQSPFVFALERGNTDGVTVVLYTIAAVLLVHRKVWLAGMATGIATGFKLSPAVAVVVMTGALAWARRDVGRWTWLRWSGGSLTAFVLTLLAFPHDAKIYLFEVLPKYMHELSAQGPYGHSLPTYVGDSYRHYGKLLGAGLLLAWVWGGARAIARGDMALALAGALAVSTYLQATSNDYNLITTYPLLLLLFLRAQRTNRWTLLVLGLFSIAGDRQLFTIPGATVLTPQLHFTLQLAFLVVAALVAGRPHGEPIMPAPQCSPEGA